ncbi:MAG: PAS-domain containing protein [Proteobacteria bacterium]|nr:PAS-domain containing protein [Pseudomonadota bacterium]
MSTEISMQNKRRNARARVVAAFAGLGLMFGLLAMAAGYAFYDYNLRSFLASKGQEKQTALQLADAFIATYAETRTQFGSENSSVPATFRAHALERFNRGRDAANALRMTMVGFPGREIKIGPADPNMAETIRGFADSATPRAVSTVITVDGVPLMRTVHPSLASQQSCVDCHNRLQQDGPRWRLNDVMGAMVIDAPAGPFLRGNLIDAAAVALSVFMASIGGSVGIYLFIAFVRRERAKIESRAQAQLAGAMQNLSDGIAVFDKDDRLVMCNDAYRRMHAGLDDVLEPGTPLFDKDDRLVMCNDAYRRMHAGLDDVLAPGTPFEAMLRRSVERGRFAIGDEGVAGYIIRALAAHRHPDGAVDRQLANGRWEQLRTQILADGGRATVINDITAVKDREAQLRAAKEAAEAANRAKSEFLAKMSHELLTPLNAIIGFSDIIRDLMFGPEAIDRYVGCAADIHGSGQRLLDVINDIIEVARLEDGRAQLKNEEIDVAELVESCRRRLAPQASAAGIALRSETEIDMPRLRGDEQALNKIVMNLLSNAVKFTGKGGQVIATARRAAEGGLTIEIRDTGIGIVKEQLAHVFEPFQQADTSLSRAHQGTGLGLTICKKLVELQDGALAIASQVGKGTTATVRFPAQRVVQATAVGHPAPGGESDQARASA